MEPSTPIHLLYAPTEYCNMSCQYCYLGALTENRPKSDTIVQTLNTALTKMAASGHLPFNLSFHGGEVTTLPTSILDGLFDIATQHYAMYGEQIKALGFRANPLHIKTNLLNFQKNWDLFVKHKVSISGSIDLPLQLHDRFRRDKKGNSTLKRIQDNLKSLSEYPYNKKISCVVTKAHLEAIDAFIDAINYLHYDIGLDMSRFNIMFGFSSNKNIDKFKTQPTGMEMLSDSEQVAFYRAIKKAFQGTPLESAFKTDWFKEFTPDFCCSSINCGEKFFLLRADGDLYSCPRGQSSDDYRYGNIFEDDIQIVFAHGKSSIERNENRLTIDDECTKCQYLPYCNLGCTFVRQEVGLQKSYTCLLQKEIYKDNPERYSPYSPEHISSYALRFFLRNNLKRIQEVHTEKKRFVTPELSYKFNWLSEIIDRDADLRALYRGDLFFLRVNGVTSHLRSAILKNIGDIEVLDAQSEVLLGVRSDIFDLACHDNESNYLHLMLLRDIPVVYGDEGRTKQEHIFDYSLYKKSFTAASRAEGEYALLDISSVLTSHEAFYRDGIKNNLFFTTKALREYHYTKQKKNAFYHIQAINLPFHNIEFFWHRKKSS
jgi:uncharacterized protein